PPPSVLLRRAPRSPLFPYTTLFRSLVLAGRFAVLTSAQLWPQGRYLVADLQTIAERNDVKRGGEVERMLAALSADSLAPDANSQDRKSTRLNSSHVSISYAVFCLKK